MNNLLSCMLGLLVFTASFPGQQQQQASPKLQKEVAVYSCTMHPAIKSKSAGRCPKCGMNLVRAKIENVAHAVGPRDRSRAMSIPDVELLDQDGRKVHFYSDLVKEKVVAINFIFTTCTTICPPMGATFARVQRDLGNRDAHFISISVDPVTDTPERLKAWSEKFKAGPGWTLVTGDKQKIDELLRALAAATARPEDHSQPSLSVTMHWASGRARTDWPSRARSSKSSTPQPTAHSNLTRRSRINMKKILFATSICLVLVSFAGAQTKVPAPSDPHANHVMPATKSEEPSPAAKYFSDVELLDQDGRTLRFYSDVLKGKTVVINALFTTCTGVCPPISRNFERIQQALGERLGKDVFLVSITVDPVTDTPAKLKEYSQKFHARAGWSFLTGKKENIDWALYKLGQYVQDKNDHQSIVIIGNEATGLWKKAFGLASAEDLIKLVEEVMNDKGVATK